MKNMKEIGYPDYCVTKDGKIWSLKVNRFLKPTFSGDGYLTVHIYNSEKKLKNLKIHRAVALTFLAKDEGKIFVNHKDGNKSNNNLENLEWVTPSENNRHAHLTGLRKPTFVTPETKLPTEDQVIHDYSITGETKLSDDDIHLACQMLEDGYRVCDISKITGYDRRLVQSIRDNDKKQMSHIVELYDFSKIKRKNKSSVETVISICEMLQDKKPVMQVVRDLSVCRKLVENIKNRKFHIKLSQNYVW